MEDFLNKLRSDALYIRLVSDRKFGGAVDIRHLVKALTNINLSYKNYIDASLKHALSTKSKATEKEIKKLISESELLLVDLNFSSFKAGISPNTVLIENTYASIKDAIDLKKKSFTDFKSDVFHSNYNSTTFKNRIKKKFTEEERLAIYKPIIENVFNDDDIKLYFGNEIDKTDKRVKINEETVDLLIPQIEVKASKEDKDPGLYVAYVSASGEVDLFGERPKLKYLAFEKLEKPTYPYQVQMLEFEGKTVMLSKTISADVSYDEETEQFIITYSPFNINAWGQDRSEAEEAFNFTFISLIESIFLEDDKNLTIEAIAVKRSLRNIIKSV